MSQSQKRLLKFWNKYFQKDKIEYTSRTTLNKKLKKLIVSLLPEVDENRTNILPRFKTLLIKLKNSFSKSEESLFFNLHYKENIDTNNIVNKKNTKQFPVNNLQITKFVRNKKRRYQKFSSRNNLSDICFIPSIINSITNRISRVDQESINLIKQDLLVPLHFSKKTINIIIVMDMSKSVRWFVPGVENIINNIINKTENWSCKLGLVVFNNNAANTIHYPTKNIKNIIGSINNIKVSGFTPLAQGIEKAFNIFNKPKYDSQFNKNIILLISDCFPEPISGGYHNMFNEKAYKKVLNISDRIKNSEVQLIIINPSKKTISKNWGHKLGKESAKRSDGKYIRICPERNYSLMGKQKWKIDKEEIKKLNKFLDTIFS